MLENLNQLSLEAKQRSDQYDKKEFVFSDKFKHRFKELLPSYNIDFQKYTSVVKTSNNLLIIVPNQWFVIASFFNSYLLALKNYKNKVIELGIEKNTINALRENKTVDPITEIKIVSNIVNIEEAGRFRTFLSNYDWWFGSKTVDRADYFVSPILNLAGVMNDSQSFIATLSNLLSEYPELIEILDEDYNSSIELIDSPTLQSKNIIYYGSPGTGKSHKVNDTLKNIDSNFYERITFHPEYDNASFIGGYKPISESIEYLNHKEEVSIKDELKYKFVPQVFTNIYKSAWQDLENHYYLAIEEINRGNCAEIFGDVFQLLDRKSNYTVSPSEDLKKHLILKLGANHPGIKEGLKLPPNLSILATMNTSDQSLFPMDSAFKRRWDWEYIPICYNPKTDDNKDNASINYYVSIDKETAFSWIEFIKAVNLFKIKENPNLGTDKCIGNYFIKPEKNEISLKEFINKAIFYLWNDVFKDEDERDSIFRKGVYYEDFFPIETNGEKLVLEILTSLNIKLIEKEPTIVEYNENTN